MTPQPATALTAAATATATATAVQASLLAAIAVDGLELPPLPQVAIEAAELAARPDGGAVGLAALIQRDVALASQVMRVANSALYARRAPIVSLQQAVGWLGVDTIRNIALAFTMRAQLFGNPTFETQLQALWRESMAVACFAQEIARAKRRNVETAYLCGLLHRVGYAVILWRLGRASLPADSVEQTALLQDELVSCESQVGAQLARTWRLPEPVAASILGFRTPLQAQHARLEVMQVALARVLAAGLDSAAPPPEPLVIAPELLEELGVYPGDLARLLEQRDIVRAAVATFP